MSELMRQLIGVKPYPIPACAIRPMPFPAEDEIDPGEYLQSQCECLKCKRPDLTVDDFYLRKDGRLEKPCKKCISTLKNARRRAKKCA